MTSKRIYDLEIRHTGALVRGLDIASQLNQSVVQSLKEDLRKHGLLIFKNQKISPDKQIEFSEFFGELYVLPKPNQTDRVSNDVYVHSRSPHPAIFCVSNDARFGSTGVGTAGWHNDGLVFEKPFAHSIYHMVSVPSSDGGATCFADLRRAVLSITDGERAWLSRIYLRNVGVGVTHPLIYPHPETGDEVFCLGLGSWDGLGVHKKVYCRDPDGGDQLTEDEMSYLEKRLITLLDDEKIKYDHRWEADEIILTDNLAVAHLASSDTQRPSTEVGLRLLHRTSILGRFSPLNCKNRDYNVNTKNI